MQKLFFAAALSLRLTTGVSGQQVFFASELTQWKPDALQMAETTPGRYVLELPEPWLHELPYKFVVDGQWIQDPANPRALPDGQGGFNSVLEFPNFVEDRRLTLQPSIPPLEQTTLKVRDWKGLERLITVVFPNEFEKKGRKAKILYFQDGDDYLNKAFAAPLLSNFAAQCDGSPLIGVFIPPVDRNKEYGLTQDSDPYVDFVVKSVIPAVESYLALSPTSEDRWLIGDSLGGLISLYTAIRFPNLFGGVVAQSGAWPRRGGRILELLRDSPPQGLHLFAEAGLYDLPGFLEWNRRVAQVARDEGLFVNEAEFPNTHDWVGWRNRLPRIIESICSLHRSTGA